MLTNTDLPDSLWAEAMQHGNWLRNRLPSKPINQALHIKYWKPNVNIVSFVVLPTFGQPGFAFIYCLSTSPNKKMFARSIHVCFVGMESNQRLCRTFDPVSQKVYVIRVSDFKPCRKEQLSSISTLIDGLSRRSDLEAHNDFEGYAEEGFPQSFTVKFLSHVASSNFKTLAFLTPSRMPSRPNQGETLSIASSTLCVSVKHGVMCFVKTA